jgi:hypothetical protein
MVIDIDQGYESIGDSIQKNKTYRKLIKDIERLKKKNGNTFEENKKKVTRTYNSYKKKYDKKKANTQKALKNNLTQLDKILDIKFLSAEDAITKNLNESKIFDPEKLRKYETGGSVQKYVINRFITALTDLKPKILELLEDEVLAAAGCSQDQTYSANQDIYIKLTSIDYLTQLEVDPTTKIGKVIYESKNLQYPSKPFPMNKELYNRTQNLNQPFTIQYSQQYKGISTQDLFDITYVELDGNGNPGSFFKVNLANRATGNKVKDFLKDYYKTIEPLDLKNVFANLMNILTGAISIAKGDGENEIGGLQKLFLIMQRVLGLCFDSTEEIDVSGSAKVSELDNVDDSFFEFDEIDINFINEQTSNVLNGVAEFIECDNVKLPINQSAIIDAIDGLNFIPGSNNSNSINNAENLTKALTDNPDWLPLKINIDGDFIREFPKAVVMTVLSPKVILPFATILYSLGNNTMDKINSYEDFYKKFRTFFINVATKIGAIFLKIIFDIIVKDIKNLIKDISGQILKEKQNKKIAVILALTQILLAIAKVVTDFRKCKSVIDDLKNLLNLTKKSFGDQVPLPLLLASKFVDGFSASRATLNVIEEFEKLGLPTGPMPDGSPNLMLAAVKGIIDGIDKEQSQNGQVQVAVDFLSITPIGQTIPKVVYGKSL